MRGLLLLPLAALLLAGCEAKSRAVQHPFDPASLPDEQSFLASIDKSRGFRDCFTPVRQGKFVEADEATGMTPTERVLGLDLGDVAFAYPIQYLNFVEIVEHTAKGQELLVCW